ncbi:hypothetical protein CH35J_005798 [Colletotrichum higginsianum]|uniref:HNH nuclease domain-containing protein n=1 Tax=Colletotrichum higginsianum TaxID=80884 RepID=A0A4T0W5S6_9PEZI|nr:hypothetical protein CH35J_005798 [Colletotrichum higginsianum]
MLKENMDNGRITMPAAKYNQEVQALETSIIKHERDISIMLSCKNQLIGVVMDEEKFSDRLRLLQEDDWHYIDHLINRMARPAGAVVDLSSKRSKEEQDRFRTELIKAHGQNPYTEKMFWCPIGRSKFNKKAMVAAHIVKHNVGENSARALFGEHPTGHINSVKNGLMMLDILETAWDQGRFVIVPVIDDHGNPVVDEENPDGCLQVIVLDNTLQKEYQEEYGSQVVQLNNCILKFYNKNTERPSRRYLYFKYVTTILRRERFNVRRATGDRQLIQAAARGLWASPGTYLQKSTLYKLSRQLGCLTEEEANRFWSLQAAPMKLSCDEEDVTESQSLMTSASLKLTPEPHRRPISPLRCESCNQPLPVDSDDEDIDGNEVQNLRWDYHGGDGEGGVEETMVAKATAKDKGKMLENPFNALSLD